MPPRCLFARIAQVLLSILSICIFSFPVFGQDSSVAELPSREILTVERIFKDNDFKSKSYSVVWLENQSSPAAYTLLEPSKHAESGQDIVRYDASSGESSIMVSALDLIPPGETVPIRIDSYAWSGDHNLLLIYTNSKRVWRENTRGDYWLLDRSSRQLTKIGGDAPESSLMFAKLSPEGKHVAYVRERNLYVEDLLDHEIRQLTHSNSEDVINGTTDWVYEEEFSLRDGYRWSHDGRSIAFWQIDTTGVPKFPLVNNTDSLYPTITRFPYPKVGQRNPTARIGLVGVEDATTDWIELPPFDDDSGIVDDFYLPRMDWMPIDADGDQQSTLLIQQMNRLQNTNRLMAVQRTSSSTILVEKDEAWVDILDCIHWTDDAKFFTWLSERDGWRQLYLASRDGRLPPVKLTQEPFDVIEVLAIDQAQKSVYYIASPDAASQRYLYRSSLTGGSATRVTPVGFAGTHQYEISPDCRFAVHTMSSAGRAPITELISLPEHQPLRMLVGNEELQEKIDALQMKAPEFFRVPIGNGVSLEAWCIKPPDFDASRKYPLLVYVYGEPAGTTVVDRWGGSSALWHWMMAQRGYVVMSFDNRGTDSPRGRPWRKSIYQQIGILPPQDQADAVKSVLAERSYLDADRVAIWGWSGGGSSSLHAIFKYPELYKAAIAVAPVPNQRYYDTIYQERYMSLPTLNVEGFRQGSAINFAKQLEGNLLIIHGTGDDNCHYQTTEMLIDELIAHQKKFRMMAYPNRSHAISERKGTTVHLRNLMTDFLLEHTPAQDTQIDHEPSVSSP